MPEISGLHHLALTVTDVERSAAWYQDLLGVVEVLGDTNDEVSYKVLADPASGTMFGLRQYTAGSGDGFDEFRTGLDHLAFEVTSAEELAAWEAELAARDVEYTPAAETPIGTVVVFRDPDRIQLEFWLPAG